MNPIIKKDRVQVGAEAPRSSARPRPCAKVARLLRVEGDVRGIELTCSCGETTVIELEYEDAPAESPSPGEEPRS